MFEFFIGIVVGAAFADFWRDLYQMARTKFQNWSNDHKSKNESIDQ